MAMETLVNIRYTMELSEEERRQMHELTLRREVEHWQRRRNAEGAHLEWLFDVHRAREKLRRVYPSTLSAELAPAA